MDNDAANCFPRGKPSIRLVVALAASDYMRLATGRGEMEREFSE
jgi:hypothetical protein